MNSSQATVTDGIDNPRRQAAFIGQVAVESAYLTTLTQGKPFGVVGNGTKVGRGYLQLTGRPNDAAAAKYLKLPLAETIRLLATDPATAANASGWYWQGGTGVRNINTYADAWNITAVSQLVNAGRLGVRPNGLAQRLAYSQRALQILLGQ